MYTDLIIFWRTWGDLEGGKGTQETCAFLEHYVEIGAFHPDACFAVSPHCLFFELHFPIKPLPKPHCCQHHNLIIFQSVNEIYHPEHISKCSTKCISYALSDWPVHKSGLHVRVARRNPLLNGCHKKSHLHFTKGHVRQTMCTPTPPWKTLVAASCCGYTFASKRWLLCCITYNIWVLCFPSACITLYTILV